MMSVIYELFLEALGLEGSGGVENGGIIPSVGSDLRPFKRGKPRRKQKACKAVKKKPELHRNDLNKTTQSQTPLQ